MNFDRNLHRVRLTYPRTTAEAFKDASYGAAIERPWPSAWKRFWLAVWRWL